VGNGKWEAEGEKREIPKNGKERSGGKEWGRE
jgi:hypothetical protein